MSFHFATYASEEYIPFLENCLLGCRHFLHELPCVYAFDQETRRVAQRYGCIVRDVSDYGCERHVYSLEILRACAADWTILIDADCWPTQNLDLGDCVGRTAAKGAAFGGDIGQIDLGYLFKTTGADLMVSRIHDVVRRFPMFAAQWGRCDCVEPVRPAYGDVVVDLPLLYGGFAVYRTVAFKGLEYPEWIHSADIWLSMHAIEHGLSWHRLGRFQFNRNWCEGDAPFVHLAGPKSPGEEQIRLSYRSWIQDLGR